MSSFRLFTPWAALWSRSPTRTKGGSGASGEDGGEFGLDFPDSQMESTSEGPLAWPGLRSSYGSVMQKKHRAADLAERSTKIHAGVQQGLVLIVGIWILVMVGQRLCTATAGSLPVASAVAPSPAPGGSFSSFAPTCAAYTYPQCEAAIRSYLLHGAKSRCEAFERVKAEGDFVKFPYSASQQDSCPAAGCCGCSGQCSKCPPLLSECSSWRLDGSWKVAFGDGSEATYTFDAHGHCEVELSSSVLPVTWKEYDQAYIPAGKDAADALWSTISDAKKQCGAMPACKAITYDSSTRKGETFYVYLKAASAIAPAPGTAWKTMVEEQRPELHGTAALAGPLTQHHSRFRLDLHKVAPQLFPDGSSEQFSIVNEELQVERRFAGMKKLDGVGVRVK